MAKKRFAEGLKFKVLQVDGVDAGMIECMPGKHTWRPVDAADYMVIHCLMIAKKQFKGKGLGLLLVEDCVAEAKRAKMAGVAVVTSSGTWMVSSNVFLRCGFECVDTAPPSFELLAKQFRGRHRRNSRRAGTRHCASTARGSRSSNRINARVSRSALPTSSRPARSSGSARR